ncbi:hypothetical protein [Streptomyces avermitilis]|uniref:hypothetical protein n=1 Tax=Streptomyces avermitilis TaxID=33903 RepID=UPI003680F1A6
MELDGGAVGAAGPGNIDALSGESGDLAVGGVGGRGAEQCGEVGGDNGADRTPVEGRTSGRQPSDRDDAPDRLTEP